MCSLVKKTKQTRISNGLPEKSLNSGTFEVSSRRTHCQAAELLRRGGGGGECRGQSPRLLSRGGTHWVCAFRDPALRADEGGGGSRLFRQLRTPTTGRGEGVASTLGACHVLWKRGPPIDYVWMVLPPLPSRSRPWPLGLDILLDFDPRPSERNEHIVQEFAQTKHFL